MTPMPHERIKFNIHNLFWELFFVFQSKFYTQVCEKREVYKAVYSAETEGRGGRGIGLR